MAADLISALLRQARAVLDPLLAAGSPAAMRTLLHAAGWNPSTLAGLDLEPLVVDLQSVIEELDQLAAEPPSDLLEGAAALARMGQPVADLTAALSAWTPPAGLRPDVGASLAGDLAAALLEAQLWRSANPVHAALRLIGVLDLTSSPAIESQGEVLRAEQLRPHFDLAPLGRLLNDPAGFLAHWRTDDNGAQRAAEVIADIVGPLLADTLQDLGLDVSYGVPGIGPNPALSASQVEAARHLLLLDWLIPAVDEDGEAVSTRYRLAVGLADSAQGIGVVLATSGDVALSISSPAVLAEWKLSGVPQAVVIDGSGVVSTDGQPVDPPGLRLDVTLPGQPAAGPAVRLGASGTRFEIGRIDLGFGFDDQGEFDVRATCDLQHVRLSVSGGDGDGFLTAVVPPDLLNAEFDVALDWSLRSGLRVSGGAGLAHTSQIEAAIGPIVIESMTLAFHVDGDRLGFSATTIVRLALGPFLGVVTGMGVRAGVALGQGGNLGSADLSIAFQPPSGVGLAIESDLASGGGFLRFDEAAGQYAGVFELTIAETVSVKVVALISTKLPDGRPGFALLIIITAEGFTPIQLGMGFVLTGVGGLLALNRTVELDAVRGGLKSGVLDSVLFIKDPARNAGRLISTLNRVFPQAPDRLLIGPMITIGWGSPTIITARVAVLLELPDPLRLVVLASVSALLPDAREPVLQLRVDAVGALDFKRGELSLDASIFDSRLWKFALSGDLALRLRWGSDPQFLLAVGGFHPRYLPPAGFPALERIALTLSDSDNPRLRLDCYFAITSNSIQFGAHVELFASALGFELLGAGGFDALIQWNPFLFMVDVFARVAVRFGGFVILAITVELGLLGPDPWRAHGRAEVQFLMFKAQVSFELQVGEDHEPRPVEEVDVADMVWKALTAPASWSAALTAEQAPGVTLRDLTGAGVLAHPLATLTVRQRVAPLGVPISRFGAQAPKGGTATYHVTVRQPAAAHTDALEISEVTDRFALGQFQALTDDQRLSQPAFVERTAGFTLAATDAFRYSDEHTLDTRLDYETLLVDSLDSPARLGDRSAGLGTVVDDPAPSLVLASSGALRVGS